jgi:ribosomal protein S18 acetylase RimI-like enzyme
MYFQILNFSNIFLAPLLALAIGNPTPEKIQTVISSYSESDHYLVGCFVENKLVGVIGFEITDAHKAVIRHLAVDEHCRGQGIGKKLIEDIAKRYDLYCLEVETDNDAIGFYRKCNFVCEKFDKDGMERFRCISMKGK